MRSLPVQSTLIWNFKNLRAHEGTHNHSEKGKGTLNVPALFPDLSVGTPNQIARTDWRRRYWNAAASE